jgi:hypothetical protein
MVLFTPTIVPTTSNYTKLDATVGNAPNLAKGGIVGSTRPLSQFSPNSALPPSIAAIDPTASYGFRTVHPGVSMVGPVMTYQRSALGTYTLSKGFAADPADRYGAVDAWPSAVDPFMKQYLQGSNPNTSMRVVPNNASVGYQRMSLGTYTAEGKPRLQ